MKFMITIALTKEFGGWGFVTTTDVDYVRRCSSTTNKLRSVHSIRGTPRDIAIKEREIKHIKIKNILFSIFLVETVPLKMDKFKFKRALRYREN